MVKRDVELSVILPTASLKEALERLGQAPCQILFTLDNDKRVSACLTDGDIRRAFLQGHNLDSPIENIVRRNFTAASSNMSDEDILKILRTKGVRQIPILDERGILVDVRHIENFVTEKKLNWPVVIMAGGRGRRLRPFTETVPKPLLKVGGHPIIARLISSLCHYGITEIHITLNYLADKIMTELGDGSRFGCHIHYVIEEKELGTAGSLGLLKNQLQNDFFVFNGDVLTTVDLRMLSQFHNAHDAVATVCSKSYNMIVPYGVLNLEGENVTSIEEKPQIALNVNAGVYVFSQAVLKHIDTQNYLDMPMLLERLIAAGARVKCFQSTEPWIDIGSREDYERASQYIEKLDDMKPWRPFMENIDFV